MGALSLKETLVLFSVYLSGECRITRVRETLSKTTEYFSGAELRNDLPGYLENLLQSSWLCGGWSLTDFYYFQIVRS